MQRLNLMTPFGRPTQLRFEDNLPKTTFMIKIGNL